MAFYTTAAAAKAARVHDLKAHVVTRSRRAAPGKQIIDPCSLALWPCAGTIHEIRTRGPEKFALLSPHLAACVVYVRCVYVRFVVSQGLTNS